MSCDRPSTWLALMIGNSRLHWAVFTDDQLQVAWDMPYLLESTIAHWIDHKLDPRAIAQDVPLQLSSTVQFDRHPELWFASVVPSQTGHWQAYSKAQVLTLKHVPLQKTYPTLGVDRALAVWGAIALWGSPALVVDAGTALTFTGADLQQRFVGGAILPGLQLQMRSLTQHTAALPSVDTDFMALPPRWATNTPDAIRSGVFYSVLISIQDVVETWLQQFPTSAIAITGGDSTLLYQALQTRHSSWGDRLKHDPNLVLRGIAAVRQHSNTMDS